MNSDDTENTAEVLATLRSEIAQAGSARAWCAAHGFSPQFITDVLRGRRDVTPNLGKALGYRRVWVKREDYPTDAIEAALKCLEGQESPKA
jgi:hypothetical protein